MEERVLNNNQRIVIQVTDIGGWRHPDKIKELSGPSTTARTRIQQASIYLRWQRLSIRLGGSVEKFRFLKTP